MIFVVCCDPIQCMRSFTDSPIHVYFLLKQWQRIVSDIPFSISKRKNVCLTSITINPICLHLGTGLMLFYRSELNLSHLKRNKEKHKIPLTASSHPQILGFHKVACSQKQVHLYFFFFCFSSYFLIPLFTTHCYFICPTPTFPIHHVSSP